MSTLSLVPEELSQSAALVTGSAGYVGRALVRTLCNSKRISALACLDRVAVRSAEVGSGAQAYHVDLRDRQAVLSTVASWAKAVREPLACIHLAGLFEKDFAKRQTTVWSAYYADNVRSTQNIVDALYRVDVKTLIFMSTALAYEQASVESGELAGVDHYLRSKIRAEQIVRDSGLPHVIFRPSRIVGLAEPYRYHSNDRHRQPTAQEFSESLCTLRALGEVPTDIVTHFLENCFNSAGEVCDLVVNRPSLERSYVHLADVVSAIRYALENDPAEGFLYLGSSTSIKLRRIGAIIVEWLRQHGIYVQLREEKKDEKVDRLPRRLSSLPGVRADSVDVITAAVREYGDRVLANIGGV